MTILKGKNAIIGYLLKNPNKTVISIGDIESVGFGAQDNEEAVAAFLGAMDELKKLSLFKEQEISGKKFWILHFPLTEQDQDVKISYPIIDAIAKTIEQYTSTNAGSKYIVDRSSLTDQDISMLLYIISDLINNLSNENNEK
jgi:hypothetical protein